jgi:hypothetical protein
VDGDATRRGHGGEPDPVQQVDESGMRPQVVEGGADAEPDEVGRPEGVGTLELGYGPAVFAQRDLHLRE